MAERVERPAAIDETHAECQECGAMFFSDEDGFDAEDCMECGGELIEVVG